MTKPSELRAGGSALRCALVVILAMLATGCSAFSARSMCAARGTTRSRGKNSVTGDGIGDRGTCVKIQADTLPRAEVRYWQSQKFHRSER